MHSDLWMTDRQGSVLGMAGQRRCYTPFGHIAYGPRPMAASVGYAGQWREAQRGHYALGHGHRIFLPSLLRFAQADAFSPFGRGGRNAMAYCAAEPVNRRDPSGRSSVATVLQAITGASNIAGGLGALNQITASIVERSVKMAAGETLPALAMGDRLADVARVWGATVSVASRTQLLPGAITALEPAGLMLAGASSSIAGQTLTTVGGGWAVFTGSRKWLATAREHGISSTALAWEVTKEGWGWNLLTGRSRGLVKVRPAPETTLSEVVVVPSPALSDRSDYISHL